MAEEVPRAAVVDRAPQAALAAEAAVAEQLPRALVAERAPQAALAAEAAVEEQLLQAERAPQAALALLGGDNIAASHSQPRPQTFLDELVKTSTRYLASQGAPILARE